MSPSPTVRAEDKADVISQVERIHSSGSTCLFMRLGEKWYAVPAKVVELVAPKGSITRVPRAPAHLLGIASLRGKLLTVASLDTLLGIEPTLSPSMPTTLPRLVVMKSGGDEFAIVADEIFGLDEYTANLPSEPSHAVRMVKEYFDWRGNHVALLEVSKLFEAARELAGMHSTGRQVHV